MSVFVPQAPTLGPPILKVHIVSSFERVCGVGGALIDLGCVDLWSLESPLSFGVLLVVTRGFSGVSERVNGVWD